MPAVRREEIPVDLADQAFTALPVDSLGLGVNVREPPVAVQHQESVGDALQDVLGFGAEFPLPLGGDASNPGELQVGGDPCEQLAGLKGLMR